MMQDASHNRLQETDSIYRYPNGRTAEFTKFHSASDHHGDVITHTLDDNTLSPSLLCGFPSLSIEESEGKYSLLIALFCHGEAENKIEKFSMPSNFPERKCVLQNL